MVTSAAIEEPNFILKLNPGFGQLVAFMNHPHDVTIVLRLLGIHRIHHVVASNIIILL